MYDIKYLIIDVDGTMTDGKIYMSGSGETFKAFNVKDGYAIKEILPIIDITPVIVTGRESKIVKERADELGIKEIYQGVTDKLNILAQLKDKHSIDGNSIACIGDDYPDYCLLKRCVLSACPSDSSDTIKSICNYVLTKRGGEGAVSEFILILHKLITGKEYVPGNDNHV